MKDKITKTFVLKKAHVTGDAGTLHDLIKAAMSKCDNAYDRQMEPEEGADRIRILNDWTFLGREEEVCVASFFSFTMNENKNAVVLKKEIKSFPIEVLAPQRKVGHHQEFVAGLAWIAVKDNYIAVMTSQSFSFTALEDYFTWLFKKAFGKTVSIVLRDPRQPKFRDCDMSSVKRLEISNSIEVKANAVKARGDQIRKHFIPGGRGWDILRAIYKALGQTPPSMGATNEHAFDKIDVDVIITARRPTIADGNQADALERIANAFKDVEDPPIKAVFKDGRILSLSDYRVSKQFSITAENKIPITKDVCAQLDSWLREQIQNIEMAVV